jgi:hypothetical protein
MRTRSKSIVRKTCDSACRKKAYAAYIKLAARKAAEKERKDRARRVLIARKRRDAYARAMRMAY